MAPRKRAGAPAKRKKATVAARVKKAPITGKDGNAAARTRGKRAALAAAGENAAAPSEQEPVEITDDPEKVLRNARKRERLEKLAIAALAAVAQRPASQPAPGSGAERSAHPQGSDQDQESPSPASRSARGMVPRPSIAGGERAQSRPPKKKHKLKLRPGPDNQRARPASPDADPQIRVGSPRGRVPSRTNVQLPEALARYGMKYSEQLGKVVLKKLENDTILSRIYPGEIWTPREQVLGQGAYGRARLFQKRDADGAVIDSIVVKDCVMTSWTRSGSLSPWYPNDTDSKRQPVEIEVMRRLTLRQDESAVKYCANLRASRFEESSHFYQLYMDYYPNGTLADVHEGHVQTGRVIPEPVIWGLFDGLVTGCEFMAQREPDEARNDDGMPIVHRDLKHGNVFLKAKAEDEGPFPAVWTPVIGDFGMSVFTNEDDVRNPFSLACGGTQGWLSSEQLGVYDHETMQQQDWKLSEKTNIWGVGLMVLRLMSRRGHGNRRGSDNTGEATRPSHEPKIRDAQRGEYSLELCTLVDQCLVPDPADRIGLAQLRTAIEKHTNGEGAIQGVDLDRAELARWSHEPKDFTFDGMTESPET